MTAAETYNWMHTHWFLWLVTFYAGFFFVVAAAGFFVGIAVKDPRMSRWYILTSAAAFLAFVSLGALMHLVGID